jgi:NitT/TauT family transport system permease protein
MGHRRPTGKGDTPGFRIVRHLRHPHVLYQSTPGHQLASIAVGTALVVLVTLLVLHFANPRNTFDIARISAPDVLTAATNTFFRMFLAYVVALVLSLPLALVISRTPLSQKLLLPVADILQSVPVLAFFPVVIVFFTEYHAFELAAVFVIFISMLWNIVFPVIGGLQTIPDDVKSAAIVFNVRGLRKFRYITLPGVVPFVITGSLLAWAQGWTVVIVAEVLHTYIPHGKPSQDLLGLGSLLVDSSAQGKTSVFVATLATMILLVTLINFLVWQPLLHFSQRFRFD